MGFTSCPPDAPSRASLMDFSPRAAEVATTAINALLCPMLDDAIVKTSKAEYAATRGSGEGDVAKHRIGAGYIGTECERELGFRYHHYPVEARESSVSPGELRRHAEAGHWAERATADWFKLVGITVSAVMLDQGGFVLKDKWGKPRQIGWKDGKDPESGQYRMAGEVDGVIVAVDDPQLAALVKPPTIWESKKATDKKWKKFVKDTVKGADKRYYGQLQVNMGFLGIKQTLFSMLNLDTMKFYFELVPFDQAYAQGLVNRAMGIFKTKSPLELPRICLSTDDFKGKFCDYHDQCWGLKAPAPAPTSGFNPNDMDEVPFP